MELFPTKLSACIFAAYIALFTNQGILVTASKEKDSTYKYNTITVVMLTECIKLLLCSSAYIKEFSFLKLLQEIAKSSRVLLLYFVPAFLYCMYNNLTFVNLSVFDPTTYYLLLQIRVVVTGIIYQVLFKKQLTKKQWISLVLLTIGCIVKQMHTTPNALGSDAAHPEKSSSKHTYVYFIFILIQVFCSCFAGVYNEYLLKDAGAEVHLMLQNVFMYLDSIVCNFILLLLSGDGSTAFSSSSLKAVFQPFVIAVMLNSSACGIVTSVFLKNLNSILKTFASAIEILSTAIFCWLIFGIPIDIYTVVSLVIVFCSMYLYSQNPVVNKGRLDSISGEKSADSVKLLIKDDAV